MVPMMEENFDLTGKSLSLSLSFHIVEHAAMCISCIFLCVCNDFV